MTQAFQSLPPDQSNPIVKPPPRSLFVKIRAHKTGVIVGSLALVAVLGIGAYIISPARNTLVAPATQENIPLPTPFVQTPTPEITISANLATPEPTINPAVSWSTYTNSAYGYAIKYPTGWFVQDLGILEPQTPSYVVFNPQTATASARTITVSVSTRTYTEQLAMGASSSAITLAGIQGAKQFFQDSSGNTSTVIVLPRTSNLLVLRAKTTYLTLFNQMITTLQFTK